MMLCRTIQHVFSLWCVSYLALIEAETGYPFTLMSAQETPPATNSFISGPFTDNEGIGTVSICNRTDSSREAKCYADQFPQAYAASQAVIRIERLGRPHCTGWLVGDEGHIITNWHCIKTRADLYPLTFAAAAEGDTCDTDCQRPLGCSRDIYKNRLPVTFILTGGSLSKDYTLVQLHPQDRRLFLQASGYMKMRCAGPRKHEYVFIPQFPRGYGRRIAVASGNERARISALRAGNFNGCGYNQVGYVADTQGGSSGSPVMSFEDYTVVALHHCGGCSRFANTAVNVRLVILGTRRYLPKTAFQGDCKSGAFEVDDEEGKEGVEEDKE